MSQLPSAAIQTVALFRTAAATGFVRSFLLYYRKPIELTAQRQAFDICIFVLLRMVK